MKLAVIGSRTLEDTDMEQYLPAGITEIVTGGAKGIDTAAMRYAEEHGIPVKVFLPDYKRYGRGAPLRRNTEIIDYSDEVLALWDGKSRGTAFVIKECEKRGKKVQVIISNENKQI